MGQGNGWRDAGDRRPHGRFLAALLAALALAAVLPPAAGALRSAFADSHEPRNLLSPAVSGDPRVGGTLTCERGTWDDSDAAPYEYRYSWSNAEEASDATYVVTAADAGVPLACAVVAVNGRADRYEVSEPVLARAPESRSAPRLSGDSRIGGELRCTRGVWDDRDLAPYATAFSWTRDGEAIEDAEGDAYVVKEADLGTAVACDVTAAGVTTAASADTFPHAPRNRVLPVLGGDLRIGGVATCSRGGWDDEGRTPYAVAYQWLRDGEEIELAALSSYTVGVLDAGHELACRVTAEGLTAADALALTPRAPASHNAPRVGGDLRLGRTLTCNRGTWDAGYQFEYAWLRDGVPIATGASHVNTAADVAALLQCRVSAHGTTVTSTGVYPTAPAVRSLPSLSGDARLGRTLTCGSGDWDDGYAFTYEWLRDGSSFATGTTVSLGAADVGHEVRCRVRAAGLTSAESHAVVAPQPRALTAPAISGDPRAGQTLTCGRGTWDDPATPYAVAYAWFRGDGTPLGSGATRVVAGDDTVLFCTVTAAGLITVSSANVSVSEPAGGATPENRTPPALTGTPRVRGTLDCSTGTWAGATAFTYRWLRDGAEIATQSSYAVVAADVGKGLRCEVRSGATSASSQTVTPTAPAVLNAPEVSGDPRVRRTLRCSPGSWDGPYGFSYEWLRGGTPIATGDTLVLGAADAGQPIACRVQADALTSSISAALTVSAPRSLVAPSVDGDPRLGRGLTCDPGGWDDVYAFTYRWFRGATPLAGESAASHTVGAGDLASALSCEVTAESSTAVRSASVTVAGPANRVPPALSGAGRLGSVLSCGDGEWDGAYAITHRWLREGAPLATGATYTVGAGDLGHALRCEATAAGLESAASAPLTPSAPAVVRAPQIEGDHRLGTTLTCSRGDWDDTAAARYAVTYRWLRDGAPAGTASTLAVTAADVTHTFVCEVTAEGRTVATSGEVTIDGPSALTPPVISGSPQLRGELRCSRGTWDDTAAARYAVGYQWYKDGVAIAGATSPTRVLGRADLKGKFACAVTAEGLTEERTEEVEVPEPAIAGNWPDVDGQAYVGREVLCERGDWNDREGLRYTVTYRWERDVEGWRTIAGADDESYIVTAEDVDRGLRCVVTAEGEWPVQGYSTYGDWTPVETELVALDDSVLPGAADGYRLTLTNPAANDAVLRYAYLNLPLGFAYTLGSTTGATTNDPRISTSFGGSQYLQWNENLVVPANGALTLAIAVKTSPTVGDHFASGGAYTINYSPWVNYASGAHIATELPFDETTCTITGTPGDDVLTGTVSGDVLCGLGGDDVLRSGGGNDVLAGGDGEDRLDGGDGDDALFGGDGDDILLAGAGADVLRGGSGLDTVNYSARLTPVRITLGDDGGIDGDEATIAHDDGTYVRVDDDGDGEIDPDDPMETREGDDVAGDVEIVRGGRGDDYIVGSGNDEELYGGAGADLIEAGGGSNLVDGGDGDDYLSATGNAHERLFCGGGLDHFRGNDDNLTVACEIHWSSEGAT